MTVRYDSATSCTGGPTPGAIALRDHWRKVTGLGDLGIYNCRSQRGATTRSVHSEGRAVDLEADAADLTQRDIADHYIAFLIANCEALQVQYLIWNHRSWKPGRGWLPYSGASAHTDHVHVELNRDGAASVTTAQLDALWAPPPAPLQSEEDDDMIAPTIQACYAQARGKGYNVIVEEPTGFRHWHEGALKAADWRAHLNQWMLPALRKESGKKIADIT